MNLLLIPGFMADASLWDAVTPALGALGPLSHGDLSQAADIPEMARQVLAAAPPRFAAIGFSMGGYVAREIARLAPDRLQAVVLVATSARADTPERARRKLAAVARARQSGFAGLSRAAVAESLHPDRAGDQTLIEQVRGMGDRLGAAVFLRQAGMARIGDLDRLGQIRAPTLVIAARQDRLRSLAEAAELQAGIPGAQLRVIEGSGHMLPIEAPGAFCAAVIPWLRQV